MRPRRRCIRARLISLACGCAPSLPSHTCLALLCACGYAPSPPSHMCSARLYACGYAPSPPLHTCSAHLMALAHVHVQAAWRSRHAHTPRLVHSHLGHPDGCSSLSLSRGCRRCSARLAHVHVQAAWHSRHAHTPRIVHAPRPSGRVLSLSLVAAVAATRGWHTYTCRLRGARVMRTRLALCTRTSTIRAGAIFLSWLSPLLRVAGTRTRAGCVALTPRTHAS